MNSSNDSVTISANSSVPTDPSDLDATRVGMITVYSIIFTIALSGNILIIYIVTSKPYMRSTTNFLIANMAVADILMTVFAMPYSVIYLYVNSLWFEGIAGYITCKAVHFTIGLSIAASIITLIVISLDRFFAIVYPFRRSSVIKRISITITAIWVTSAVLLSPYLYMYKVIYGNDGFFHCLVWFGNDTFTIMRVYNTVTFTVLYVVPLALITLFYLAICRKLWLRKIPGNPSATNLKSANRSKKRSIKMLIIIVAVFAVCWLPAHVMHFYVFYYHDIYKSFPPYIPLLAFFISHANSAINPFLYITLNKNFMRAFVDIIEKFKCWKSSSARQGRSFTTTSLTNFSVVYKETMGLSFKARFEERTGQYQLDKSNANHKPVSPVCLVKFDNTVVD